MKKKSLLKTCRKQLMAVAAGVLLTVLMFLKGGSGVLVTDGTRTMVKRPGYGEAPGTVTVQADGENVTFCVSGRKRTEYETKDLMNRLAEQLPEWITAEGETTENIRTGLRLENSYEGFAGISVSWMPEDTDILEKDGNVRKEAVTEKKETGIRCTMTGETSEGTETETFVFPLTIFPGPAEETEESRVERLLKEADQKDPSSEMMTLPESITYAEKKDLTPLLFTVLGVLAAVLLSLKPAEEEKKRKKDRELELTADYSDVVSKFLIYTGAGLTVRNAFLKLAPRGRNALRAVDRELEKAAADLGSGMPEGEAYGKFAAACGLRCYMRFAALLERNGKTGDASLANELELELAEAFDQRKNAAKRAGEEAGTKLAFSLILSLAAVLAAVSVPAILQMNL